MPLSPCQHMTISTYREQVWKLATFLHTNFGPYPNDRRKKHSEVITAVVRSKFLMAMAMMMSSGIWQCVCSLTDIYQCFKGYTVCWKWRLKFLQKVRKYLSHYKYMASWQKRPPERTPLVGEVRANFYWYRVSHGQRDRSPRPYSRFSRPEPLLFFPSSSSIVLTRLSGACSRFNTCQNIW
jgi:hypothetical protein